MLSKSRHRRPSWGAVSATLSCLALFFALGGVGYAKKLVHLIDGSTIKKGTIQVDRLSSKAQKALKGNQGPQGFQGFQGPQGGQGPQGNPGANGATGPGGPTGAPGTARAYGRVAANGALTRSKNVTAVTRPFTGGFCIFLAAGIDATQTSVVATPDLAGDDTSMSTDGSQTIVEFRSDAIDCQAGAVEVRTGKRTVSHTSSPDADVRNVTNTDAYEPFFFVVP